MKGAQIIIISYCVISAKGGKMKINTYLKYMGAVLAVCGAIWAYADKAQGHYQSRMVEKLPAFHAINVQGDFDVDFMQHPTATAHVSGPEKSVQTVSLSVKDGVLNIGFVRGSVPAKADKLRVMLTGPALHEVTVSGKGDVHIRGKLQTQDLSVTLTQEGDFSADGLTVKELHIHAAGKSEADINRLDAHHVQAVVDDHAEIELAGLALSADLQNHGTGEIDAADMRVQMARATVNGKGTISVSAYEKLHAAVLGKGKIKYRGSPVSLERDGNLKHIVQDLDD